MPSRSEQFSTRVVLSLVAAGLFVGLLSGLFGVGGGAVIVPALVYLGLSQREAAATSLIAIFPTALTGCVTYATTGNIDWLAAGGLTVGLVAGVQIGTYFLTKFSERFLRWAFVAFLVSIILVQSVFVPNRGGSIRLSALTALGLVALGVACGFLSGILGIGGGGAVIPALCFIFGASDLAARGISLVSMIPGTLSGAIANLARRQAYLKTGLIIGVSAVCTVPVGAKLASLLSPRADALLFAAWQGVLLVRSVYVARQASSTDSKEDTRTRSHLKTDQKTKESGRSESASRSDTSSRGDRI